MPAAIESWRATVPARAARPSATSESLIIVAMPCAPAGVRWMPSGCIQSGWTRARPFQSSTVTSVCFFAAAAIISFIRAQLCRSSRSVAQRTCSTPDFSEDPQRLLDVVRVVVLVVVVADGHHDDGAEVATELRRALDDVRRADAVVRAAQVAEASARGDLELEVDARAEDLARLRVVRHRGRGRVPEHGDTDLVTARRICSRRGAGERTGQRDDGRENDRGDA